MKTKKVKVFLNGKEVEGTQYPEWRKFETIENPIVEMWKWDIAKGGCSICEKDDMVVFRVTRFNDRISFCEKCLKKEFREYCGS